MNNKNSTLSIVLTSIPMCLILSALTIAAILYGQLAFEDRVRGFMIIRVVVSVVVFIVALIAVAGKRHSLFINCIFFGTMCYVLSQVWIFANFVWIEQEAADSIIEIISSVGFYMFLFSASYGALDSLADDRSNRYIKYRIAGAVVSLAVAALFVAKLMISFSVYVLVYGLVLCPVIYISVKHLLIPDIENGYVRTLRPYYFTVLLAVLIRACDTLMYGVKDFTKISMISKMAGAVVVIWLFPMAIKGVRKWTSL